MRRTGVQQPRVRLQSIAAGSDEKSEGEEVEARAFRVNSRFARQCLRAYSAREKICPHCSWSGASVSDHPLRQQPTDEKRERRTVGQACSCLDGGAFRLDPSACIPLGLALPGSLASRVCGVESKENPRFLLRGGEIQKRGGTPLDRPVHACLIMHHEKVGEQLGTLGLCLSSPSTALHVPSRQDLQSTSGAHTRVEACCEYACGP